MNDGVQLGNPPLKRVLAVSGGGCQVSLLPYLNKPFAFFGHSMGALISFELARLLRRGGQPEPNHLFISARRAPQIPDLEPPSYNLPHEEFIAELRRLNGTPREILEHPEMLQLMIPILRADFRVCQTYSYLPEAPLECSMTVYGGEEDLDITPEHLEAWKVHTQGSFNMRLLPGDHFFLHHSQKSMLQLISYELHRLVSKIVFRH